MVSREQRRRIETSAISSTAARKGPSFAFDGLLNPLVFLTNWRQAARTSSLFKIQMRKKFSCDGNLIGFLFDHCAPQVILSGHGDRERQSTLSMPDFLVHGPGDMAYNYAIMEVKSERAKKDGIRKDLTTLSEF